MRTCNDIKKIIMMLGCDIRRLEESYITISTFPDILISTNPLLKYVRWSCIANCQGYKLTSVSANVDKFFKKKRKYPFKLSFFFNFQDTMKIILEFQGVKVLKTSAL